MIPEVRRAAEILRAGGLVAFPTETVYGLGADASSEKAIARLYAVKGRPADHPVIIHLDSLERALAWARRMPNLAWGAVEVRPVDVGPASAPLTRGA